MYDKVIIAGASYIDIIGYCENEYIAKNSNFGKIVINLGGSGKNIAENLSLLGITPDFISVVGNDEYGKTVLKRLEELKIDTKNIKISETNKTGMYLNILDKDNSSFSCISDMSIADELSIPELEYNEEKIFLCVDTNFSEESLKEITEKYAGKYTIMLETVSVEKAVKAKDVIGKFDVVKANIAEAGVLTDIEGREQKDIAQMGNSLLDKGVKEVYILAGTDGVYAFSKDDGIKHLKSFASEIKSDIGAGDAMTAGIVYSKFKEWDMKKTILFSSACAAVTLESDNAVNPEMSYKAVSLYLREKVKQ